ncbi:hypothetical protein [Nostoc sp.]|uniref:hypothetical protein n=1 Tax=Nostoc sp. TaxID=1180 RepID=UPI002FFA1BF5
MLQPTMFMQTLDNGWSAVLEHGRFYPALLQTSKGVLRRLPRRGGSGGEGVDGRRIELRYVRAMRPRHGQPCGTCGDDERGAWAYH